MIWGIMWQCFQEPLTINLAYPALSKFYHTPLECALYVCTNTHIIFLVIVLIFLWWGRRKSGRKTQLLWKITIKSMRIAKYKQTYKRNDKQKNPLQELSDLIMDCHAASSILLKDFSYPIGKPFILKFGFLFTLFFLHKKQRK